MGRVSVQTFEAALSHWAGGQACLRWPAAQVTGIDLSATSVRCIEDLRRKYNLNNLQVRQLPVERASDLAMSFDQVVFAEE
jgi:hypothetical protein